MKQKLDRLFQKLSNGKRCYFCYKPAQCSHHLVRRNNLLYRWYFKNALPLCFECHYKIHNGQLKEPEHELKETSWHGKITKEFMLEKKRELEECLNNII